MVKKYTADDRVTAVIQTSSSWHKSACRYSNTHDK